MKRLLNFLCRIFKCDKKQPLSAYLYEEPYRIAIVHPPVLTSRNPTPKDKLELGTYWINKKTINLFVKGIDKWEKISLK